MALSRFFAVFGLLLAGAASLINGQVPSPLSQAYVNADRATRAGQYDQAERILRAAVTGSPPVLNQPESTARERARLLALLAQVVSTGSPSQPSSLYAAETDLAWAIHTWPCTSQYWQSYVDVRLRRQGKAALIDSLRGHELIRYTYPGSQWTIAPPVPDGILETVVSVWETDQNRGIGLLDNQARLTNRCTAIGQQGWAQFSQRSSSPNFAPATGAPQPSAAVPRPRPATPSPSSSTWTRPAPTQPVVRPYDPSLDEALGQINRGDFKRAWETIYHAGFSGWTEERAFARLVISLALRDGVRAQSAFSALGRVNADTARRCEHLEIQRTITFLISGRSSLQKENVGELLSRIAVEFPANRLAEAAALAYDAKVLKGDSAVLAAKLQEARKAAEVATKTEARLDEMAKQLLATQDEVRNLNAATRDLLTNVGILQRDASSLQERVILDERHLTALDSRLDDVFAELAQRQAELEQRIERGDPHVLALLAGLRTEVRNLNGVVGSQREALASLVQRYPAVLSEGHQPAPVVTQQLHGLVQEIRSQGTVSQVLGYVANAVSIGKSFGRFSLNVVGILAALAGLLGA
jgi:hypothetical protein